MIPFENASRQRTAKPCPNIGVCVTALTSVTYAARRHQNGLTLFQQSLIPPGLKPSTRSLRVSTLPTHTTVCAAQQPDTTDRARVPVDRACTDITATLRPSPSCCTATLHIV